MVNASMFFAIFSVFQLSVIRSNLVSKGSYFIELGDAQEKGSDLNLGTTVFSENFHKCSLMESCRYLSLDTNTNKYTQISNEDEIPKNRTGFKIWKKVTPEGRENKYTIHIGGYTGDIGDSMTAGIKFSTWDNDNDYNSDRNCAATRAGPWWYKNCSKARLMSYFFPDARNHHERLKWDSWVDLEKKITFAEMKLRA
eukprot:gene6936-12551_t